ncbi:MAG: class I adenylate-forming enzyme family protein [Akkermansia sp.]|nr:class I adenylate-forming enzyme family protein [Akkermansia sp.]
MNTIVEAIARHAEETPSKTAINVGKESLTYAELWKNILCAADNLSSTNQEEVVIFSAEKSVSFISHYFAAHLIGIGCVLVDSKITSETLESIATTLPVCCFFSSKDVSAPFPIKRYILSEASPLQQYCFPAPSAIADYMFTTGTTGRSKCVPLTHANLLAAAKNINTFIGNTASDHELIALPLCHSFGLGRLRCSLLAGGTCTIISNFANERKLLKLIGSGEITGFSMVPAAWHYIRHLCASRFIEAARHNLRFIEIGSAALPMHDKLFLMENLPNTRICMHYGLTEASRSTFIDFHNDFDKLSTCGKPTPGVDIAIFSKDGRKSKLGESGEICIKGQHVTIGYLHINTEQCFFGSYFRTGDLGFIDLDGYLHLQGRIKELINVGGKKVSPDEVEHIINQIPGIAESACIAAKDPEGILGEVVKAYIVPENSTKLETSCIIQHLREHLEPHKVPRILEFRFEPIPRTDSGKLQRQKLSEE